MALFVAAYIKAISIVNDKSTQSYCGGNNMNVMPIHRSACRLCHHDIGMEWNRRKRIIKTIYLPAIGSPPPLLLLKLYTETQLLWLFFSCLIIITIIIRIKQYYIFNFYIVFIADMCVDVLAYILMWHIQLSPSSLCILLCVCVL